MDYEQRVSFLCPFIALVVRIFVIRDYCSTVRSLNVFTSVHLPTEEGIITGLILDVLL